MSDIDEALEALERINEGEYIETGHDCYYVCPDKQDIDTIRQALEQQRELQDALKHTTDLLDGRDYFKRHYEMVARVRDNRAMLAAAPAPCDHDWINAENEAITSGYWCRKCNAVRAARPTQHHDIESSP